MKVSKLVYDKFENSSFDLLVKTLLTYKILISSPVLLRKTIPNRDRAGMQSLLQILINVLTIWHY